MGKALLVQSLPVLYRETSSGPETLNLYPFRSITWYTSIIPSFKDPASALGSMEMPRLPLMERIMLTSSLTSTTCTGILCEVRAHSARPLSSKKVTVCTGSMWGKAREMSGQGLAREERKVINVGFDIQSTKERRRKETTKEFVD